MHFLLESITQNDKFDTLLPSCFKFIFYTLLSLPGNSGRLAWVRLQQPQEQRYGILQVHAWSFRFSVIHGTLALTTGSLACVRDHSCACVFTLGLGTPTTSQHNILDSGKLTIFSCAPPDGVRASGLWFWSPTLYQWSHPATPLPELVT